MRDVFAACFNSVVAFPLDADLLFSCYFGSFHACFFSVDLS